MAVGILSSANLPSNLGKVSFNTAIARLMPNGSAPLFALTSLLKDETVSNITHGYFSKSMVFKSLVLSSAIASGAVTTFPVTSSAEVVPGDMFRVDTTGENIIINTVASATSVTVDRGIGTTAAAAIASGVTLYHIGNAFEEGSNRPQAVSIIASPYQNYTQIFRNSWALTNTMAAIPQIAGSGQVSESKQECAAFHALAMELMLFFGQKYIGTRNGQAFHTSEGLIPRIQATASSNITTLLSTTNWTQLEDALDKTLNTAMDPKSGNQRIVFCGSIALRVINAICRLNSDYSIVNAGESSWGLRFLTLVTPRGTFDLIEHPLFNAYGSTSAWAKMAVIVDLSAFSMGYLRRTTSREYGENGTPVDSGIDAQGGTLTTEVTCIIKNPAAFGIIYNFTAAAIG
jgi:Family of unknown function (DUF5309)